MEDDIKNYLCLDVNTGKKFVLTKRHKDYGKYAGKSTILSFGDKLFFKVLEEIEIM